MEWVLRMVATFGVIEPLQHQLGAVVDGRNCVWSRVAMDWKNWLIANFFVETSFPLSRVCWLCLLLQNRLLFCS